MMNENYFFIDGSALTAQIRLLQSTDPTFQQRKLCPRLLLSHFMASLQDLHGNAYKRATFYFPRGDEAAVADYLRMPDHRKPGEIRDIHFKFCGQKLKKSAEFAKFVEEKVPSKFQGRFAKSEKGIDIEICCDALRLASAARLDRLFLLTNDGDFIPLCRTLREFGANISILHLSTAITPNDELLREADSYDVVSINKLNFMFFPLVASGERGLLEINSLDSAETSASTAAGEPQPEKPTAEPSDLKLNDDSDTAQEE